MSKRIGKRTVMVERELGPYEFQCKGCKKIHKMGFYAIAQTGMGVAIVFTCECGTKTHL